MLFNKLFLNILFLFRNQLLSFQIIYINQSVSLKFLKLSDINDENDGQDNSYHSVPNIAISKSSDFHNLSEHCVPTGPSNSSEVISQPWKQTCIVNTLLKNRGNDFV